MQKKMNNQFLRKYLKIDFTGVVYYLGKYLHFVVKDAVFLIVQMQCNIEKMYEYKDEMEESEIK